MADRETALDPDSWWKVRLDNLQRIVPSTEEHDDDIEFAVEFELSGPGVNATATTMMSGDTDERMIVSESLKLLQEGLERWARAISQRVEAEPANDV